MLLRVACVVLKGDWPYLRKAMSLASGFSSKRVCHFCAKTDPQPEVSSVHVL